MELCIPFEEPVSKDRYAEIVQDSRKVDQIVSILIRYNNLDPSMVEYLSFAIPKIDPWDFKRFRDGEIELRKLRNKILRIRDDYIPNMDDINDKVYDQL